MKKQAVIALLGGGQLGRMFIENALRYALKIHVLDPDPDAPCANIADRFVVGDLNDTRTVVEFARDADVVGIEIEHVSVDALEALKEQGKRVIPDPAVLRIIQDKGLQKQFYSDNSIPSSDFVLLDHGKDLVDHSALLPGFLKSRTGGYDGKGVMKINSIEDADRAFESACVLEKQIAIEKELAVMVVQNDDGSCIAYDPVEMVFDQKLNLVDHLRAPARCEKAIAEEAKKLALRVAKAFNAPGIYAVELFLTQNGKVLVNETAPRAHNSAHHTIEACASSQFDQLLRCYMQWPIGNTELTGPSAMFNLVGSGGTGYPVLQGMNELLALPGVFMHSYGKKQTRNGRKMGHITVVDGTTLEVDRKLKLIKRTARITPSE